MTSRARWLAALDGRGVDRLPFWPKIDASYAQAQEPPFREMRAAELHAWVGSDRHDGSPSCLREVRRRSAYRRSREGDRREEVFETPGGSLRRRARFDAASASWHPVEMPVRTVEDVKLLTSWYRDVGVELDVEALAGVRERFAALERSGDGVLATGVAVSPLMDFVQHLAGVETAHFLLFDHPGEVGELLAEMGRVVLEKARLVAEHHPADLVYMIENTSTTLISPEQYRAYCVPVLSEVAALLRARGRRLCLHMCGLLRAILPEVAGVGARAWEAFTSPPVGNTRLADGRAAAPEVCLIGGTNAALWTRPADEIVAEVARDLDALPHHRGIVVTSAGVMPPPCRPETIRAVRDWLCGYPART
jgi:uroporphyrinogen-III decarboxylase